MSKILADLRLALRAWRKSSAFTAIAIASIALGIGANAAIFTLVDQVLLRTLPVKDPDAIVQVSYLGSAFGNNQGDGSELSYGMFVDFRDNNQVFDGVMVGTLATLLAVVGLYGVMAYTVARRTREIGIRMALGARATTIGWLVIREVLIIAMIGVTLALPAAWWLSRQSRASCSASKPTAGVTVVAAIALLLTVSVAAGLIPSNRAARVNPTTALRYE